MTQTPHGNVVTCPFCGYPYPMTEMQREVYRGRNMGCMNCGRPFKVEAPPPPAAIEPVALQRSTEEAAPAAEAPAEVGESSQPAAAGATTGGTTAPATKPIPPRPNPLASAGFVCALLFFALIAAATIVAAAASDSGVGRAGGVIPHTPAGILTALAVGAAVLAVLLSFAGLVRTRRIAGPLGSVRTVGRGFAVAGLVIGGAGLLITAIFVETVMPLVNRQQEMAHREQCKANLQAIALALAQFADTHGGRYPDSLADLVAAGKLLPSDLACPSTTDTPAAGATPAIQAAALSQPGHQSYVYVAKGLTASSPAYTVLAYEPASNHEDVAHVLFLDGLIVSIPASSADQLRRELDTGKNPGATAKTMHQ